MKTHGQSLKLSILRSWSTAKSNKVTSTLGTSTKTTSRFDEINKTNKCKIKRDTPGMAFLQTNTSTIQNWVWTKNRQITTTKQLSLTTQTYPCILSAANRWDAQILKANPTLQQTTAKQRSKRQKALLDCWMPKAADMSLVVCCLEYIAFRSHHLFIRNGVLWSQLRLSMRCLRSSSWLPRIWLHFPISSNLSRSSWVLHNISWIQRQKSLKLDTLEKIITEESPFLPHFFDCRNTQVLI